MFVIEKFSWIVIFNSELGSGIFLYGFSWPILFATTMKLLNFAFTYARKSKILMNLELDILANPNLFVRC